MTAPDKIRADYYVYEHWRPDTGVCFYVGKGRKNRAWIMACRNPHHQAVRSKLVALGMCVDVRIIVKDLLEETAYAVEQDRICFYGIENLTNRTEGGPGLPGAIPEVRRRIGRSKLGNKNMVGRKLSEETKRKISEAHKGKPPRWDVINRLAEINRGNRHGVGRKASPETRAKMSAAHIGKHFNKNVRKWTDEERAAHSARHKGKKMSPEAIEKTAAASRKPVQCIDDGKVFISAIEAGKFYGLFNHVKVAEVCRGVRKTAAGRAFRYIPKDEAA